MSSDLKLCTTCTRPFRTSELRTSWFTGDDICADCMEIEHAAPNFSRAHLAGLVSLAAGGCIEGIGFTTEDIQHMTSARKTRAAKRQRQKEYA